MGRWDPTVPPPPVTLQTSRLPRSGHTKAGPRAPPCMPPRATTTSWRGGRSVVAHVVPHEAGVHRSAPLLPSDTRGWTHASPLSRAVLHMNSGQLVAESTTDTPGPVDGSREDRGALCGRRPYGGQLTVADCHLVTRRHRGAPRTARIMRRRSLRQRWEDWPKPKGPTNSRTYTPLTRSSAQGESGGLTMRRWGDKFWWPTANDRMAPLSEGESTMATSKTTKSATKTTAKPVAVEPVTKSAKPTTCGAWVTRNADHPATEGRQANCKRLPRHAGDCRGTRKAAPVTRKSPAPKVVRVTRATIVAAAKDLAEGKLSASAYMAMVAAFGQSAAKRALRAKPVA